jgi:hypothetical protein
VKIQLLIVSSVLLILASCEFDNKNNDIVFKTGDGLNYRYGDLEMYDSSTHILYFKELHPEFDKIGQSTFTFLADGEEIYTGSFWPAYFNSLPNGPFISSPLSYYQHFALRIDFLSFNKSDPRNEPVIIQSLKAHDLLHSGLSVLISQLDINGTELSFSFTVTNHDKSDLLILDPDKTGPRLFHYFTNGLTIRNQENYIVYSGNIEHESPTPWDSWKIDWLSQLKSGQSRTFTLNYSINAPLNTGEYKASFEFPGLAFQVSKEELFQNEGRIWLGDIQANKTLTLKSALP